jgi:UTP--glucose-1-phosphate uridylyltransferase
VKVRKAVIPAGGVGTRFLPTSKAIPKELLPLFDKPLILYAVEEAVASGIDHIILVTSPGKEALQKFFEPDTSLESFLEQKGQAKLLDTVRHITSMARFSYVEQKDPLGLGHASLMAKDAVGREPFAVMLPDDVIRDKKPALASMIDIFQKRKGGVIAVEEVAPENVSAYGVIKPRALEDRVYGVDGLVEKPPRDKAPSNLAIVGRYVLPAEVFDCLERTRPGAKGEIQLTDALAFLMETHPLFAYRFPGARHDGGNPLGLLKASLAEALSRDDARPAILDTIKRLTSR